MFIWNRGSRFFPFKLKDAKKNESVAFCLAQRETGVTYGTEDHMLGRTQFAGQTMGLKVLIVEIKNSTCISNMGAERTNHKEFLALPVSVELFCSPFRLHISHVLALSFPLCCVVSLLYMKLPLQVTHLFPVESALNILGTGMSCNRIENGLCGMV